MKRTALAVLAAASLVVAGCSDDDDPTGSSDDTGVVDEEGTQSQAELVADATSVAVAYFEARAVHDFDTADDNAEGAADLVIDWDEEVSEIDGLEGTPYEVVPVEAPEVRVNISAMEEGSGGTYAAEGFIELGHRPSGVASTTTTTPPEGAEDLGETTFVTDLEFVRDGDTLRITDYRFDDVPYPVSELYVEGESEAGDPAGTTSTTEDGVTTPSTTAADDDDADDADDDADDADDADVTVTMGHRDVDGSVQWLVDHEDDAEIVQVRFMEGDEAPAPDEVGVELQVFPAPGATGETGDEDDGATLVVHAGAFPGELPGTLRFEVETGSGAGPVVAEARVLDFPELGEPRPTNTVRDAERDMDDTTTTTEPDDSTTTTFSEDEGDEVTPTTTTGEDDSTTTSAPTTSTSSTSTTSTTEAG